MEITISKSEFEEFVPVAESSHDEVYNSILPHFKETFSEVYENVIGSVGADAATDGSDLLNAIKRHIAITTFLMMMEQKDVVLTATGFGVVSNDQVAPASTARVEAVRNALKRDRLRSWALMVKLLTAVEGWGETDEAKRAIDCPLWSITEMGGRFGVVLEAEEFQKYLVIERRVMTAITDRIGEDTVEYCLDNIRQNRSNDYDKLTALFKKIIVAEIDGDFIQAAEYKRKLMKKLFSNLTVYTIYAESEEYQAEIESKYENKEDDSTFFFD